MTVHDHLTAELIRLARALDVHNVPFLLGGGMGLYVRSTYHVTPRQPAYPRSVPIRPTKDLDVFIGPEVIVSAEQMTVLRDVLTELGYVARESAQYYQFERGKSVEQGFSRIDLLAAPPLEQNRHLVHIKEPRIRPMTADGIHARVTNEALDLTRDAIAVNVHTTVGACVVHIPSSYNYLILKLHAYADRREQAELAGHHALDIFRIVTDMSEEDWRVARLHRDERASMPHLQSASKCQRECFDGLTESGIIAMQETEAFRIHRNEFEGYLSQVINDLRELFA